MIYRRHARWLGSVLRRQLGSEAGDAEDLVQETYIRAARYDDEAINQNPKALLRQIAVNLARDHMRRNVVRGGRAVTFDEQSGHAAAIDPAQESELLLKQLVLGLPKTYRDVFLLSRFTQMTYDEIACHQGVSIKTVEWRMSKALAHLAVQIRD